MIGELREAAAVAPVAELEEAARLGKLGFTAAERRKDTAVGARNAAQIKAQADARKAANDPEFEKEHPRGAGAEGGQFVAKGSTDTEAVKAAQRKAGVKADGVFGPDTLKAVQAVQKAAGLTVDGVIGHATLKALMGKSTSKADEGKLTAADRSRLRTPKRSTPRTSTRAGAGYGSREADEGLIGELHEATVFSIARQGWSEVLHPRGQGGKFADKPDAPKPAARVSRNPTASSSERKPQPKVRTRLRPGTRAPERTPSQQAKKLSEKELIGAVGTGPWSKGVPELTARLRAGTVEDSETHFRPKGKPYPPERVALHARIANLMLQGAGSHAQPEALFLAGGPASGKSSLVNGGRARPRPDAVDVNPDIVRAMLPEYQALLAAGDQAAAAKVHEEASHISKMVMNLAVLRRHHVTVDGTGNGKPGAYVGKIEAARAAGLDVRVVYASIPTELAVTRSKERAERQAARTGKAGRQVPEGYLRSAHQSVSRHYIDEVSQLGVPIEVYDNSGKKPKLVAQHDSQGRLNVVNPRLYQAFVEKADPKAAAARELRAKNDPTAAAVRDLFGQARSSDDIVSAARQRDRAAAGRLRTRTRRAD